MTSLKSYLENLHRKTTVCSVCDVVFCDTKSLLRHFFSHFNQDGNLKPVSLVRENATSFQVPANARDHIVNEYLGALEPPTLVWFDSQVPASVTAKMRRPVSTHRYQPYPPTLTSRSPISRVPVEPVTFVDLASDEHPQTAMENQMEDPLASVTRPLIEQLEKPTEEMTPDVIDVDAEELDLTLMEDPLASVTRPLIEQLEKPTEEMTPDVIDVDAEELDLTLKL
ncbi:hypothetical protein CASFOL_005145 [Castilleja foliolosa]|uniref:C2H2-type domain-containing protein n=1 Tax=Castilleja foliolosa TaxID=1961234 RepID=A0ABD3E4M5_9LAMI